MSAGTRPEGQPTTPVPPDQAPGARRADSDRGSPASRVLRVVGPAVLVLVLVLLLLFGDSLFGNDPEAGPEGSGSGAGTAQQAAEEPEGAPSAAPRQVATVALRVLRTWSAPDLAYERWWKRLSPLLTPGGREAYAFTDPARVPDLRGLEVDEVTVHGGGIAATVYVTTSEGRFGVDLSRRASGGRWLAQRVVFPGGTSMFAPAGTKEKQ